MNILLFINQSFSSLKANKLRSFLSTLGIIIGILSFVIMLSIGEGAKKSILDNFGADGNIVKVNKGYSIGKQKHTTTNIFTEDIVKEIPQKVPNVKSALGLYESPSTKIVYKVSPISGTLSVVSRDYFSLKKAKVILGSYFGEDDFEKKAKIAIIGYKIVRATFKDENPIGKNIMIGGHQFKVSGVLAEKGWEFDNMIFIPSTTSKEYLGKAKISSFEVFAKDDKVVDEVVDNLKFFLMKKSSSENFVDSLLNVESNKQFIQQIGEFQNMFSYFLIGIGAISLIVGGIGIMNIMLVSVTERTREIGIKKAIGATNFSIMLQFLIESIILTLIGSLTAILLSYGITYFINGVLKEAMHMEVFINSKVLIIAISVSVTMGIVFGLMPAYKASRLKPIDALHFE